MFKLARWRFRVSRRLQGAQATALSGRAVWYLLRYRLWYRISGPIISWLLFSLYATKHDIDIFVLKYFNMYACAYVNILHKYEYYMYNMSMQVLQAVSPSLQCAAAYLVTAGRVTTCQAPVVPASFEKRSHAGAGCLRPRASPQAGYALR